MQEWNKWYPRTVVEIENLPEPVQGQPKVNPEEIAEQICGTKNPYRKSFEKPLVNFGKNSVFYGFVCAFTNHYPFVLSPDAIWLLILQGFSRHININSERFRDLFVSFKGKKDLLVERLRITPDEATNSVWDGIFTEFSQVISNNLPEDVIETITPDFSTTTELSRSVCNIAIMSTFEKYFNYTTRFKGCGIPYVTIEGTIEDWESIKERLNFISKYDLEWWTSELIPVIDQIINTLNGDINLSFWKDMVRKKDGTRYHPGYYDGWFTRFFPYDKANKRLNLKKISTKVKLPDEVLQVPLKIEVIGIGGISSTDCFIYSGFVGLKQNPDSFQLKPKMGWMICKAEKQN
ncbi:DUF4419 domain-containing protein [Histomonas meleagridis]|uniref:DUF4419 domain-containing protein n=1 Tax=Histomonas meleagridis TaxID=135588 RepID=UPI00355AC3DD|nr:DUF4419 domain-containing protein [Histomonas meleagridis]KAH0807176.1 DUF4419 domain-containing protein [Histomonas meleagridis]